MDPQIPDPKYALYPVHVSDDGDSIRETPHPCNIEVQEGVLIVEPQGCGVFYRFPLEELKMAIAEAESESEPCDLVSLERQTVADLQTQLEVAETQLAQAESSRDDAEQRVQAVVAWADEEGHGPQLESELAGIIPPSRKERT